MARRRWIFDEALADAAFVAMRGGSELTDEDREAIERFRETWESLPSIEGTIENVDTLAAWFVPEGIDRAVITISGAPEIDEPGETWATIEIDVADDDVSATVSATDAGSQNARALAWLLSHIFNFEPVSRAEEEGGTDDA